MLEALPTSQNRPEQLKDTAADSRSPANRKVKPVEKHTMKCSGSINLLTALECLETDIHITIHFLVLSGAGQTELQMCKLRSFLFKKMYLHCKSIW